MWRARNVFGFKSSEQTIIESLLIHHRFFAAESNRQFNGNVSCTEQTAQLTSSATHAFDMHPCLDELIGNKHYTTLNAMSADQMNEDGNVAYNQFHDSIFIVLN